MYLQRARIGVYSMKHTRRRLLAIVTAVFMALTVWMVPTGFAAADDITEIEWTEGVTGGAIYFNKSTQTITKCDSAVTSAVIPSEIDGEPVTAIGYNAFRECDALTSVTIPDSVTVIKEHAFDDCSNMTDVAIPGSVTSIGDSAFRECDELTVVEFPDSVISIGEMAYYSCDNLKSVTISKGVTTIKDAAFGCSEELTKLTVAAGNTSFSSDNGVLYNKDKTVLLQYPIGNSRPSYTILDSVTTIGYGAFWNCRTISNVTLPNRVRNIEPRAFCGCSSLTGITIPNGVTAIGNEAFASCSKLLTVAIPDSVTSIGNDAFKPCKSLISITVGDNNEYYASDNGVLYDKKQKALLLYPSANNNNSYVIPDGVMTIGKMAFYSCKSLTDVTIPDSVTSIGNNALDNCKSLTSITVDENNKYYSSKDGVLFNKDRTVLILYPRSNNRKSYIIPDSVTTIEEWAFESCNSLTGILIPDSVTSIELNSFPWIETLTLFANKGSYAEQVLSTMYPFREIISTAPSKVSANLYKQHDTLKVSWDKVAGADGYYVYYKKSTWKNYQQLGTTTSLSYSKAKLADGAKYKFAVYPYMNIGDQKYRTKNGKSSDYVYTLKKLKKPGVKKSSRSYVRVSWNNIPGESGYQIARSKSSTKNFKIVKRVSKNYKSTKIKTPRYKKYYYKVRAYKTVNGKRIYGPWSSGKSYRLI